MTDEKHIFNAEVRDVFSGDDLVLMIDLGVDELHKRKRFRLHGVDTPNAVGMGPDTEAGKLRTYVYQLTKRQKLMVTVVSRDRNSWVGVIEVHTDTGVVNLNEDLISKGYAFKGQKVKQ